MALIGGIKRYGMSVSGSIFSAVGIFLIIHNIGVIWPETWVVLVLGGYTIGECLLWIPMGIWYKRKLNNAIKNGEDESKFREKYWKWNWPTEYIGSLRFYEGLTVLVISVLFVES